MQKNFENTKAKWLDKNGFNQTEEVTYVYYPADSYEVKEDLKAAGFRFSQFLLWHIAEPPTEYKDLVVPVPIEMVAEIAVWGEGNFFPSARNTVEEMVKAMRPIVPSNSHWIGEEGEKVKDLKVVLEDVHGFQGAYGYTQIVKFSRGDDIIKWFTAVNIPFEKGDELLLSGTIKSLTKDKYEDDNEVTVLTRCKLKEV